MGASAWAPGQISQVNSVNTLVPENQIATAGQVLITLLLFTYAPNTDTLMVFVNGVLQVSGVDYLESSASTITFTSPLSAGDRVSVTAFNAVIGTSITSIAASKVLLDPPTGGLSINAQIFLHDFYSVRNQGAVLDGITDDAAIVQSMHDNLPAKGGVIFIPGTICLSTVNISKQCTIIGQGKYTNGTTVIPKNTNSNIFNLTGSGIKVANMAFLPNTTQTGGSFILINTTASMIEIVDISMNNWFRGIICSGISDIKLSGLRLSNGIPGTGVSILINSGVVVRMYDIVETNALGSEPLAGLIISNGGDITGIYCQFIHNITGVNIDPGNGQVVASVYFWKLVCDNNKTRGFLASPIAAGGVIQRCTLDNGWYSSTGNSTNTGLFGLELDTNSNGGVIDGFDINNSEIFLNDSHGLVVTGSGTKNVKIIGNKIAGNGTGNANDGLLISQGATDITVSLNRVGPCGSINANGAYGIHSIGANGNNITVTNNDVTGAVTAGINMAGTGTGRRVSGNSGYNPVGTFGITVSASPFTYTAADTPETIFIVGGTVSVVRVNGFNIFAATNCTVTLAPGQTVIVTYSALPIMIKQVD